MSSPAPQVLEPQTLEGIEDDFDLFMLIENFNTPHCEYEHLPEFSVCSHQVTHRISNCQVSALCCQNAADVKSEVVRTGGDKLCRSCRRPIRNCWAIVPYTPGGN